MYLNSFSPQVRSVEVPFDHKLQYELSMTLRKYQVLIADGEKLPFKVKDCNKRYVLPK